MHTKHLVFLVGLLSAAALQLHAAPRTSASYTIPTDTIDSGGKRATSASYRNDGSLGGITGISAVAAPAEIVKHGYIGQLYDVIGLTLTAASLTVNEGTTDQLSAWRTLDDGSFLAVTPSAVTWGILSGPLTGIGFRGLVTAGTVFNDTPATVQGAYLGQTGTLGLTVLNVNIDDYGSYAADGIGDSWQVQYFGLPPNANAGPLIDPDGDGQNNLFEYTAGIDPIDPLSRFNWRIENVTGQPTHKNLIFSPCFNDRTYIVKAAATLGVPMTALPGPISDSDDNNIERTVTDTNATGAAKFYTVEISKP